MPAACRFDRSIVRRAALSIALVLSCGSIGEVAAQQEAGRPLVALRNPGRTGGVGQYAPDTWALVTIGAVNRSGEPAEVTASVFFTGEPTLQYARRLWIPARSGRNATLLVRTPPELAEGSRNFDFQTLLFRHGGDGDVLIPSESGEMLRPGSLRVLPPETMMGAIFDGDPRRLDRRQQEALHAAEAIRVAVNHHRHVQRFYDEFLPDSAEALDGLDQLVLAGDRLASDAAGLVAIRRWLHDGGRLWIMLDRVSAETVSLLLEDAWACQIVDRVDLSTVSLEGVSRETQRMPVQTREFEDPVEFVRIVPGNLRETFRVNGWPAAGWLRVGRGRVLLTTLAARAWTRERSPQDGRPLRPELESEVVVTDALLHHAAAFVGRRQRPRLEPPAWQPVLNEQIGYQIVGRGSVLGVLGAFCVTLAAAGLVLARQERLDWMRWLAPAASIVTAAILLAFASGARQAVPSTVAVGQMVDAAPGSSDLVVTGVSAIYHQEPTRQPIRAAAGGVLWPDMTGLSGTTRRMLWTDLDQWQWHNLSLPGGIRAAPFRFAVKLDRPLEARAAFGPGGLEGRFEAGPFTNAGDALIATPTRMRLGLNLQPDGTFSGAPAAVQAPGEFVAAGLLSDEQRRRQAVYERLWESVDGLIDAADPVLLVWADPLDDGLEFPEAERRTGSALVSIPLELERTPPDTRVRIPAPFISYRAGPGPGETGFSSAYDNRTGHWEEKGWYTRNWLRFQLPASALPVRLERARLTLNVGGPAQRIELVGVGEDRQPVVIETRNDPVGTMHFEIARPDLLATDVAGGLLLGVFVGLPGDEPVVVRPDEIRERWKIEFLHLEAEGQTLP